MRRVQLARFLFSVNKQPIQPKAPKFLSGQLQPFRFERQNTQLYDGFTLDELYGKKIGLKHPPSVQAEMTKDSIAAILVFVFGLAIINHIDNLFRKQHAEIQKAIESKLNRDLEYNQ